MVNNLDYTRVNRLKNKLHIDDWKNVDQKQFNDLVTNLSTIDKESVRLIISQIPDLTDKVLTHFREISLATSVKHKDYLDAMQKHNELLCSLMDKDIDPNIKNKIADSLLEHSKWIRQEATQTRIFRSALTAVGMGMAFCLVKSVLPIPVRIPMMGENEKQVEMDMGK